MSVTGEELRPTFTWRWERLIAVAANDQPMSPEHIEALRLVADSEADLHQACDALRNGCDPLLLQEILL